MLDFYAVEKGSDLSCFYGPILSSKPWIPRSLDPYLSTTKSFEVLKTEIFCFYDHNTSNSLYANRNLHEGGVFYWAKIVLSW